MSDNNQLPVLSTHELAMKRMRERSEILNARLYVEKTKAEKIALALKMIGIAIPIFCGLSLLVVGVARIIVAIVTGH